MNRKNIIKVLIGLSVVLNIGLVAIAVVYIKTPYFDWAFVNFGINRLCTTNFDDVANLKEFSKLCENVNTPLPTEEPNTIYPGDNNGLWRIYRDKDYNFSLTFPDDWQGYGVQKNGDGIIKFKLTYEQPQTDGSFPTPETIKHINLLSLKVYSPSDWNNLSAEVKDAQKMIGQNDKYVVVRIQQDVQDNPDSFNAQVQEIDQILSTFKFTK